MSGQISAILDEMIDFLSVKQMKKLQQVLILHLVWGEQAGRQSF